MEFRILGPLEVVDGNRPVVLPRGRGRALLAMLVLRAGEVVAAERLIDELWGETPPPTVTTALHGLVSTLRRRLGPARGETEAPTVLETRPPGYVLAIDREKVDANRFRHLVEKAAGAPARERAARLREALGLWRGAALADFAYEPFAQREIAALQELRLVAIEERIDADLALGRHNQMVAELEGLVAEQPFRERARGQLMLALYRSGRQAEALEVYRDGRRTLTDELGIEPGSALRGLEEAILRHDPSLDPRPSSPPQAAAGPSEVGATVAGRSWLSQERKTVTVMFVDLAQTVATGEEGSDPEMRRRNVGRGFDVATRALTRHGATVEGFIGDVVVALFGIPRAHEDDAMRAVRAAVELRRSLAALNEELACESGTRLATRVGISTGEVVVGDPGQTAVSGDTINIAARLQQAAMDGEVLVGESTRRLVEAAALMEPVDRPFLDRPGRPPTAWQLLELVADASTTASPPDGPIVGRVAELASLKTAFDRTVRERTARRFTVVGEAGIGKSRLALEFVATLRPDALVVTGHCPAYGDGITFWPLRELVLQAAGERGRDGVADVLAGDDDAEATAAQIASAIGLTDAPGSAQELFPAVRRFFEGLAMRQPLVVVLEDVHWAQPTLLDLIEYLATSSHQPVLLLCLARPELLEQRPDWAEDRGDAASLFLQPLSPVDSEKLVADRLAGVVLPSETVSRLVEMGQGNPLFLRQMLAALRDERELAIPPSVHALLAARLDRLGPAERDLLRCASVTGMGFTVEPLTALVPAAARPFVDRHLQALEDKELIRPFVDRHLRALEDKELIRPSRLPFPGRTAFTFRHVLIQLAAYRSMTRNDRSQLHERFADWLQGAAGEGSLEYEEIIAYHLEQAYEQRRQIGLVGEADKQLAVRAGERLASAGRRAYGRFDVAAAENLLSRARALLPSTHPQHSEVMRHLAEAYQILGRHSDADAVLAEMLEEVRSDGDGRIEQRIRLERARIRLITGPDPTTLDAIREEAEQALRVFASSSDDAGLSQASYVVGLVHLRRGELSQMEEVAWRGLAHAERSGHPREEQAARWWVALALVEGATPVEECIRACDDLVRLRGIEHAGVLSELARLRAMLLMFDQARVLITHARRVLVERIRARRPLMFVAQRSAEVEIMAGDLAAADRELRAALELALDVGEQDGISQVAAGLSRLLSTWGRSEEAARFASVSAEHAPRESVAAQALSRVATARVLLAHGDQREAQRLGWEAVKLVPSDMLNLRADLHMDLAEILLTTARPAEATPVISEAAGLYERKGNLVGALRARGLSQTGRRRGG